MENKENNNEEKNDKLDMPELVPADPEAESKKDASSAQESEGMPVTSDESEDLMEAKPPSKLSLFLRKLLRNVVIALILFLIGVVTGYFLLQRPAVTDLSGQVESLESQVAELEGEVSDLNRQVIELTPFEEANKSLTSALANEELHVQLLSALRDVQSAQIALSEGELDAARLSLTRTEGKLDDLRSMLPADNQGVVDSMLLRLDLTFAGLDADLVAAASDLSVLENSLTEVEALLFAVP